MRKAVAGTLVAAGLGLGMVGVASPAWAACGTSAAGPTQNLIAIGLRSGCSNAVTFTVRLAKDQFGPDPYFEGQWANFVNGQRNQAGNCSAFGAGSYYSWVLTSDGVSTESGRVGRC